MKKFLLKSKNFFKYLFIFGFQFSLLAVVTYRVMPVPFTPLMLQRLIEHRGEDYHIRKEWTPIEKIGLQIPLTAVTSEDPKFFDHYGFDFEQIQSSIEKNLEKGKRLRGASTISQQTAKNIFLLPVRSFIRKGIEVYFTVMIEAFWNKKRILEVYLNIIETGEGIFGMQASANIYFKKPAKKVSANEAGLMVAVLPNPIRWRPDKPTSLIMYKRNNLLYLKQYIDRKEFYWVK